MITFLWVLLMINIVVLAKCELSKEERWHFITGTVVIVFLLLADMGAQWLI